ncbi:hypothetical protein GY45DRAFT_673982 [Cubamyces sp. BRFM 1775]|nr:hypothetical protein GY45DRAFT_673982 [Cubamyces sp. BRFM 1775]
MGERAAQRHRTKFYLSSGGREHCTRWGCFSSADRKYYSPLSASSGCTVTFAAGAILVCQRDMQQCANYERMGAINARRSVTLIYDGDGWQQHPSTRHNRRCCTSAVRAALVGTPAKPHSPCRVPAAGRTICG